MNNDLHNYILGFHKGQFTLTHPNSYIIVSHGILPEIKSYIPYLELKIYHTLSHEEV